MPLNKSQSYTSTIAKATLQKRKCDGCGETIAVNVGRPEMRAAIRSGTLICEECAGGN